MSRANRRTAEGSLFTDLYQLTMAQVYFRAGIHEMEGQFDHFYRSNPDYGEHRAGFCISAGLDWLLDWMSGYRFEDRDIECLRAQRSAGGGHLFDDEFLGWLGRADLLGGLSLAAVPEGRVVHPNVPLTVVQGPLAAAQILESPLLNLLNYQTLIATKAARIRQSGGGRVLIDFGMRRGPERGANAGARAALIGGADFSSNTGISCELGFPPKGTHAHSLVQAFMALGHSELDAFRAYAESYPDDCLLLVDTVDTLGSGVPNAIRVFEELRRKGHRPLGIRLDSGDLAYLAVQAARMLDGAGFPDAGIVLSNELDELVLLQILTQIREEAVRYGLDPERTIGRLVYGVGTRLITSQGDGALDGVYKLVALKPRGEWVPAIKVSESPAKVPNPGHKRSWRLYDERGTAVADLLTLEDEDPGSDEVVELWHPIQHETHRFYARRELSEIEPLLVEVLRGGERVYEPPSIETMRELRDRDLERLDPGVRRLVNPHVYHVSLSRRLRDLKWRLVASARGDDG